MLSYWLGVLCALRDQCLCQSFMGFRDSFQRKTGYVPIRNEVLQLISFMV